MNTGIAYFVAGLVAGTIIAATWFGAKLTTLIDRAYDRGQQAERDGVIPLRPVAEIPDWQQRPPTTRDRGASDVMIALSALTVAGLILWASGTFGGTM